MKVKHLADAYTVGNEINHTFDGHYIHQAQGDVIMQLHLSFILFYYKSNRNYIIIKDT